MKRVLRFAMVPAALAGLALGLAGPAQAAFPDGPIELVCTTSPGSGAAQWCQLVAEHLKLPDFLGVPVNVSFKSGGSNNEPSESSGWPRAARCSE